MRALHFRASGEAFSVQSNLSDVGNSLFLSEPSPDSIYINYEIELLDHQPQNSYTVKLVNSEITNTHAYIDRSNDGMVVCGNIEKMLKRDYNRQFSLFGNKGIIQRYILHIFEDKKHCIVFHGCAVRNRKTGEIIIGLGKSGSGKSAFILTAIRMGWELIATEQVILGYDMTVYRGNTYDNISPFSVSTVNKHLSKAKVFENKRLVEPAGEKILADFSAYAMQEPSVKTNISNLTIAELSFHSGIIAAQTISDNDYYLRLLQLYASEKISFPAILDTEILDVGFNGNPYIRSQIVNNIAQSSTQRIILGGGLEGFEKYLNR